MRFQPIKMPLICKPVADQLLEAWSRGIMRLKISLDLGRSLEEVSLSKWGVAHRDFELGWSEVKLASERERDIYAIEGGKLIPLSITSDHFYKLVLVRWDHPPTLEIDGIHMHRILDVTPEVDSELKVELLGEIRCKRILDVCTGLGYTAITALRRGACSIMTIEKDENVISLARLNPWSRELEDERVSLVLGDAFEILDGYEGEFDAVIHDPPRMPLAGSLYSLEFYLKLAKALKPGGRLVHYVGQPGIHKGRRIWKGVLERLRQAGFDARYDKRSRCVYGRRKR
ncbi:MAG: RsmD family RNA methyltransferase [Thaumarchaeota archaeon]|nr:RsmD family RNA methyltransferase [Nitrososphaerota archaeon]